MLNKSVTLFILVLISLGMVLAGCLSQPGEYDELAKCLTAKGVVMYGTDWCIHCKNQKKMFGPSFRFINFTNCDGKMEECQANGVEGYPTWRINGKNYAGEQSISDLKKLSKCKDY